MRRHSYRSTTYISISDDLVSDSSKTIYSNKHYNKWIGELEGWVKAGASLSDHSVASTSSGARSELRRRDVTSASPYEPPPASASTSTLYSEDSDSDELGDAPPPYPYNQVIQELQERFGERSAPPAYNENHRREWEQIAERERRSAQREMNEPNTSLADPARNRDDIETRRAIGRRLFKHFEDIRLMIEEHRQEVQKCRQELNKQHVVVIREERGLSWFDGYILGSLLHCSPARSYNAGYGYGAPSWGVSRNSSSNGEKAAAAFTALVIFAIVTGLLILAGWGVYKFWQKANYDSKTNRLSKKWSMVAGGVVGGVSAIFAVPALLILTDAAFVAMFSVGAPIELLILSGIITAGIIVCLGSMLGYGISAMVQHLRGENAEPKGLRDYENDINTQAEYTDLNTQRRPLPDFLWPNGVRTGLEYDYSRDDALFARSNAQPITRSFGSSTVRPPPPSYDSVNPHPRTGEDLPQYRL